MSNKELNSKKPETPGNPKNLTVVKSQARAAWTAVFAVIIIGISSNFITFNSMRDQVQEMEKTRIMEWRPYLNTTFVSFSTFYCITKDSLNRPDTIPLESIKYGSDEYNNIEEIWAKNHFKSRLWNTGKMPLTVARLRAKSITEYLWNGRYKGDIRELYFKLQDVAHEDSLDFDNTCLPDDTIDYFDKFRFTGISVISWEDFADCLSSKGGITMYPYILAEYKDFFGNSYNLIQVRRVRHHISLKDNSIVIRPDSLLQLIESYEWDIGKGFVN